MATWEPAHRDLLTELWSQGVSATEITKRPEFAGRTRNAVLGLAHRLGLMRADGGVRKPPARPAPKPRPITAPEVKRVQNPFGNKGAHIAPLPPPRPIKADALTPTARPFIERLSAQCAWPIVRPDGDTYSCCAPTGDRKITYCPDHRVLAYSAKVVDSRSLQKLAALR